MSILKNLMNLYEQDVRRKPSTGFPTGSRFGTCLAQLQYLQYPSLGKPEAPRPRDLIRWDEGVRTEEWLADLLNQAYPNLVGLRQEVFYFRIPIDASMVSPIRQRILTQGDGRLWGTIVENFTPPAISVGDDNRVKLRTLPNKKMGFVLDPAAQAVWAPTYVDFVAMDRRLGLVVIEAKSMSNYAFRRAMFGNLDYGKRCQLVGIHEATGCNVVLIAYRKETGHLLEIAYTKKIQQQARVAITRLNGQQEVYFVRPGSETFVDAAGNEVSIPDETWDLAEVWTPFDRDLADEIRDRVLKALLFDGDPNKVLREYGPDFRCRTCDGTGTQTMAKSGGKPLKTPKPCEDCGQKGLLDRVTLPSFPCGYCSCVMACYGPAGVELEVSDKPRYWIERAKYEASGLTFKTPEKSNSNLQPM